MQTLAITIDWTAIHAACKAVDEARHGTHLGAYGVADIFGGTYQPTHYEARGLVGVCDLLHSARIAIENCWQQLHGTSEDYKAARARAALKQPRREQAMRAAQAREVLNTARAAVRMCVALDALFVALADVGVCENDRNSIGRINGDRLNVTGLCWLAGKRHESGPSVPLAAALAFADHGLAALEAAIWFPIGVSNA